MESELQGIKKLSPLLQKLLENPPIGVFELVMECS
jgi:hypothetical protein